MAPIALLVHMDLIPVETYIMSEAAPNAEKPCQNMVLPAGWLVIMYSRFRILIMNWAADYPEAQLQDIVLRAASLTDRSSGHISYMIDNHKSKN